MCNPFKPGGGRGGKARKSCGAAYTARDINERVCVYTMYEQRGMCGKGEKKKKKSNTPKEKRKKKKNV